MGRKRSPCAGLQGEAGTTALGNNYPRTSSLVDTILTGVYRVYQDDIHRIQISLAFSFPTGIDDATFNFLLPTGIRRNIRAASTRCSLERARSIFCRAPS